MTEREQELERLRRAADHFLAGEIAAPELVGREWSALAQDGPLDGLLLDFFWACEAWEPPGPTRVKATDDLRRLARRIQQEGIE